MFELVGVGLLYKIIALALRQKPQLLSFNILENISFEVLIWLSIVFFTIRTFFINFFLKKIARYKSSIRENVTNALAKRYISLNFESFKKVRFSNISKIINSDANEVSKYMQSFFEILSSTIVILVLSIALIFVKKNYYMMFSFIFLVFCTLLLKQYFKRGLSKLGDQRSDAVQGLLHEINEIFDNYKLFKILGGVSFKLDAVKKNSNQLMNCEAQYNYSLRAPKYINELFIIIFTLIILFFTKSTNDVDSLVIIVAVLFRLYPYFNNIVTHSNNLEYTKRGFKEFQRLFSYDLDQGGEIDLTFEKEISGENIELSYGDALIFENLSFKIKKGSTVAIVGPTGAGKSSLIDIISGIISVDKGNVLVDGVNLQGDLIPSWRKKIGYLPQEIFLINGSLKENVVFSREYKEKEYLEVLNMVDMECEIGKEDFLNFKILDRGKNLSGGQKQKVALARALYERPKILIFDEPTSAMDIETKISLKKNIFDIKKDLTIIWITHDRTLLEGFDQIIELKKLNQ